MTSNMGRGIFALSDIKKGELLIVEKSISAIEPDNISFSMNHSLKKKSMKSGGEMELSKKCSELIQLKG